MQDDVIYGIILVVSFGIGLFVRQITDPDRKRLLCSIAGAVLAVVNCHIHIYHSLVLVIGSCLLIKICGPRKCQVFGYIWCFGYLVFFRTCHHFGLPKPSPVSNALQLFLTLKLVALGFEIHDTHELSKKGDTQEEEESTLQRKYRSIYPSSLDILQYSYCYIGLFTGPYYKYRTYEDFIQNRNSPNIPVKEFVIERLKYIPVIAVTFLGMSHFFSIQYVETEEFFEHPFWFRLFYMVPMFMIFRTRLYMAWLVSESMCMTSSLGAYPVEAKAKYGQGPTDLSGLDQSLSTSKSHQKYDYQTVYNLSIYGCELGRTTREGLRSWNMTVQYWLAAFVHRRIPKHLKSYGVAITMAVSAFWHGIHPGYYLSFMLVPVIVFAEDAMISAFRKNSSEQIQYWFDWACLFFKMRGFDYMCMGFLLLKLDLTLAYWQSIFFIGHLVPILFIIISKIFKPKRKKEEKKE
ncbi:lysophospholipid acyltransferase 7 [Mytilus galloprovincialis]|uniref:Lysophospholipid acyltransferase 7 n=1 Tax=Mytilus galloprovincialis TaxID=29158 RepID=A0A8B6CYR9_MYTGA|nr:lysophospholipid acyltransferase 7 [Mytilus galloprovincialis]